jgi:tetratricopeptide (TPR) repeat protein
MLRLSSLRVALVFPLIVAGCQTVPRQAPVTLTGDPLVDGNAQLAAAPQKDRALWQYRVAATALRRGQYDEAKARLDDALALAAANYGQINSEAAKSRRMFRNESDKPFIGEPYERVMANYYRGILYWRDGEPDNARAVFRSGQLLDSDTADKTYAGDYVLLDYLEGLATLKLGGDGKDSLARARHNARQQHRPAPPDYNRDANVIVFVEYGTGPRKYSGGEYGQYLKFFTEQSKIRSARLEVAGRAVELPPYDDINYQATTRGGRVMDHVLGNKAVFKGTTDAVGDVALIGAMGAAQHGSRDADRAALGLAAVGLISKIASAATTPEADIRTWENLPQYLSFAALELPPGEHAARVEFIDASGMVVPKLTQTFTLSVPPPDNSIGALPQDVVVFRSQMKN